VEQAVQERTANRREGKVRFGSDQIVRQLRAIERKYGGEAARESWQLCERYTQLLVGSMVHDLRRLLTYLKANVTAASQGDAIDRSAAAKNAKEDLAFMERTVQDMERFTRSLEGRRERQSLRDLLTRALETAREGIREDGQVDPATVACELDVPDEIVVRVTDNLIVSALANILKNAYEAFISGGQAVPQINVTAGVRGNIVELHVEDNGMGFSQEEADVLFQSTPGRRNKTKPNSTGYGLPHAIRHIAAHGGTVSFTSQEGVDTSVKVRLPLG